MTSWQQALSKRGASFDGVEVSGFGDTAAELAAARDEAVVCDLAPLGVLRIAGPEAETFLQGQLTNDVAALAPGASQYSAWCSPKGRVLANFLLRRLDAATFEMILPAPLAAPMHQRLRMFVLRAKVALHDASASSVRMGLGGPAASRVAEAVCGTVPSLHRSLAIDGGSLLQVPGARFIAILAAPDAIQLWDRFAAAARPAGFSRWLWLLIRTGVPVILPPTQDQFIPQALNLDALDGVSFQKGCYTGQEIVARTQYLGRLKERTALAHADVALLSPGTRLFSTSFGEQPCGTVLNAASAPDGGTDLLGVAQIAALDGGDLRLAPEGPRLSILSAPYEVPLPSGNMRIHRSSLNRL